MRDRRRAGKAGAVRKKLSGPRTRLFRLTPEEKAVLVAIREHRFPALSMGSDGAVMLAGARHLPAVAPLSVTAVESLIAGGLIEAIDYSANWKLLREKNGGGQ